MTDALVEEHDWEAAIRCNDIQLLRSLICNTRYTSIANVASDLSSCKIAAVVRRGKEARYAQRCRVASSRSLVIEEDAPVQRVSVRSVTEQRAESSLPDQVDGEIR